MSDTTTIHIRLEGRRPLIFDRYAGDNTTQIPLFEKVYLNDTNHLIIPAINIYSMLVAENTKSVCRQFFGKKGRSIALAIAGSTDITPFEIPILGKDDQMIEWLGEMTPELEAVYHVARLAKGVPNPKSRPKLRLPWAVVFDMEYTQTSDCSLPLLESAFQLGGKLGLGTFRPFFGRYELTAFQYR